MEAFGKHYFTDSSRDVQRDGELYGAGVSYFLPTMFRWVFPMASITT